MDGQLLIHLVPYYTSIPYFHSLEWRCMGTPCLSAIFFSKGDNFCDFFSLDPVNLFKGYTLKGKNLLLEEQILSFKS